MNRPLLAVLVLPLLAACGGPPAPAESAPAPSASSASPPAAASDRAVDPGAKGAPRGALEHAIDLVRAGDFAHAKPLLEAELPKRPRDPGLLYYLGLALEGLGDAAGAEKRYRAALALDPALAEAATNLGALLIDAGRFDDAIAVTRATLAVRADDAGLQSNLALALQGKNDAEGALAAWTRAAALAPKEAQPEFGRGALLADLGRKDEAKAALAAALAKAGEDRAMIASIAHALGRAGAFAECVTAFDRAIAAGDSAELRVERGLCKHGAKNERGAKEDFDAAVKLRPTYAPAQYYRGEALLAAGDRAGAAAAFDAAAAAAKDGPLGKKAREQAAKARGKR